GHGMVYLTAVALARSGLFQAYSRIIATLVVIVCGLWSIAGISGISQSDSVGALLFCVFLGYLFKGRSPMVYLAAFFITTWLELIGTAVGTWHWATIDPVLSLPQGNPPSGVAAWYCLVDAVAMNFADPVLHFLTQLWKICRQFLIQLINSIQIYYDKFFPLIQRQMSLILLRQDISDES
ncbi:MAG: hypothetical protein RL637_1652, partial [Pseudomonadota bacterium]